MSTERMNAVQYNECRTLSRWPLEAGAAHSRHATLLGLGILVRTVIVAGRQHPNHVESVRVIRKRRKCVHSPSPRVDQEQRRALQTLHKRSDRYAPRAVVPQCPPFTLVRFPGSALRTHRRVVPMPFLVLVIPTGIMAVGAMKLLVL